MPSYTAPVIDVPTEMHLDIERAREACRVYDALALATGVGAPAAADPSGAVATLKSVSSLPLLRAEGARSSQFRNNSHTIERAMCSRIATQLKHTIVSAKATPALCRSSK